MQHRFAYMGFPPARGHVAIIIILIIIIIHTHFDPTNLSKDYLSTAYSSIPKTPCFSLTSEQQMVLATNNSGHSDRRGTTGRLLAGWLPINTKKLILYLFRLQLLSKNFYLLEGLQSADKTKTHPKAKCKNGSHSPVCLVLQMKIHQKTCTYQLCKPQSSDTNYRQNRLTVHL